jgi:hypothetical protein
MEGSWPNLRSYSGIFLEGERKITKTFYHYRIFSCRNPNPALPKYDARLQTAPSRLSTATLLNIPSDNK